MPARRASLRMSSTEGNAERNITHILIFSWWLQFLHSVFNFFLNVSLFANPRGIASVLNYSTRGFLRAAVHESLWIRCSLFACVRVRARLSEEVCEYPDSCGVRRASHWRGLGPWQCEAELRWQWRGFTAMADPSFVDPFSRRSCEEITFFCSRFPYPGIGSVVMLCWTNYSESEKRL